MTTPLVMVLAMGVMFAGGVYLMLSRSLTRVLLGIVLFGNAGNLMLVLTSGKPGRAPLTDGQNLSTQGMSDPLPHALTLTAIVITFGMTSFMLAMIYRSWRLMRRENLEDDLEDIRVGLQSRQTMGDEADVSTDQGDTEFGDEAEFPVSGAADLDELDGAPDIDGVTGPPPQPGQKTSAEGASAEEDERGDRA